jgi:hypothetical protein
MYERRDIASSHGHGERHPSVVHDLDPAVPELGLFYLHEERFLAAAAQFASIAAY